MITPIIPNGGRNEKKKIETQHQAGHRRDRARIRDRYERIHGHPHHPVGDRAVKLTYHEYKYVSNHTLAIEAHCDEGPYGVCTVNLEDYDIKPKAGHIFVPAYKMSDEFLNQIIEDLGDRNSSPLPFCIGPFEATVYLMKLRPDWKMVVESEV